MSPVAEPLRALDEAQVRSYREKGYLVLRGVFGAEEVAGWQAECDRLLGWFDVLHEDNLRTRFRKYRDGVWRLEKYDPVVDVSPVFAAVARDPRLLRPLRDLFDDEPRLFKDKLIFKPVGQDGFQMHQDFTWWQPFPGQDLLSAMVAIDGADRENGALEVFAGYHHRLLIPAGEQRNMRAEEVEREIDPGRGELVTTEPGDVVVFHSLTPHRSGPNRSERSRRQLYLSYSAGRHGDLYEAHYQHYRGYVSQGLKEADRKRLFFI